MKSKKLSKTAIRNASVAAASVAVASVLTGCSLYGNDTYTVKFNTVGGSSVESQQIVWGEKINNPASPTKEGYTFDGWYLDANYKTKVDEVNYVVEGDVEFFAKWKINSYTITFTTNGGEEISPITKNYNSTISIDDPEREGYIFGGWYLDAALTKPFDMVVPSSDTTIYAKWIACELTITFDKNSEEAVGEMEVQTIKTNATLNQISTNTFKREGYTFAGWAISPEGEVTYQENEAISLVNQNKDITLYAVWEANDYTVSFVANNEEFATFTGDYRSQFTLPNTTPTRNGYTFVNWGTYKLTEDEKFKGEKQYFSNVGSDKEPIYELISVVDGADVVAGLYYEIVEYTNREIPLNGLKLFAIFTKNTYTISFNTNGGSVVANISSLYGEEITKPASPIKEGYTFKGWFTSQGQTNDDWGNEYIVFSTMPSNSFTLYAKWEINNYALSFNSNGGNEIDSLNKAFGSEVILPSLTRTGYNFKGWATSQDGEVTYLAGAKYTITSAPQVLHAVWEIKSLTISFEENGGSEVLDITQDYNSSITQPENPSRVGYTFDGWFTDKTFKNEYVFSTMPEENVTLYAKWNINQYTISFNTLGGSEITSITQNYNSNISSPSSPTKTGHSFAGWYLDEECTKEYTISKMPAENITLFAKWVINEYTISFNTLGGNVIDSITQNYNTSVTQPENPSRVGYTFDGWYSDRSCSIEYTFSNMPAENITLFAGWTLNSYSISFNVDGGSVVSSIKQDYNTALTKPNDPSKLGYSFAGWYLDEACTIAYTFPSTMPAENVELYAKWNINQYTISFNTNGGSDVAPITQDYNSSLVRPIDPSKVGRTFAGWYSNVECTKPYIFPDKMPAENVTVYAKWSVNSYTISFNVDGGDTLQPITMKYNESLFLPTATKTGYTFLGWATSQNGEVVYRENALYTLGAANITLYAKWNVNQYTISFNTNGGDVVSSLTQDYNTILSMPNNPSKNGHTFDGWYLDESLTSPFSSSRMPAENITLYAKWNVNSYTVSFNVDGGNTISPITEEFSSSITLPTPTKTGHTFLGWATSQGGEIVYRENASYTLGAANVTLYAKWNINQYSITFEENGGSAVDNITLNYNESITKPTNPTKEGHSFAGWYLDSNYQTLYSIPNTMPATNVTVYAKWNVNSYTIAFDSNDGVSINPVTSIYNSEITLPSTTKTGYHLLGWTLDETDTSNILLAGKEYSIPASNVTLHAIWEANTNTKYVVNHYGANLTGGGYTPIISETLEGTTDAMTAIEYVSTLDKSSPFYGFEGVMTITQEKIKPDGTTVINLYYQRQTYTVSFVDEEGNLLCSPINVIYQGKVGIIPSELVKTGYDYLLSDDFTAETIIEENVTIVVTYDARETSIAFYNYPTNENPNIQTIVRDYGTDISSLVNTPNRTGYTFEGWFTLNGESTGNWGEKYTFTTMPAESIDLYAKWSINQYTLSFNTTGGDVVSSITQDYGSSYILPSVSKTGHTFLGWAATEDGDVVATGGVNYTFIAQDVTLYAKWKINQYTISFEENEGSLVNNITQNYATSLTRPSNPERTGYTFDGWYLDEACTIDYTFPSTMPAENITLYAKWNINSYTIAFEENGGTTVNDITQNYGTSLIMPSNPTLTGYTFDGWYSNKECTTPFTLNKIPAENITVYAKWEINKYTVSFEVDNGNPVSSITKDFNTVINLPTPTKTGHTFLGWATSQGGEVVYREDASYTLGAANVTLYARWNVNEYSLSFIESDGSTLSSIKLNYGSSYTLHELEQEGHTFAGWATSQGGSVVYRKGETYTIGANNTSLYAVWIVNQYTISFNSNGGDNVANITQNYGTSLVMPSNPEKTGYTFKGWHTDVECTEAYSFPSTMPANNVTLYAKWEINAYTITINTVGGSAISPIKQNYNTAITQPADPTKLGHTFGGWYSDSSYTTTYSFPSTMPATDATIYAKWNVKSYTIAFEENGGSTVNNITQNYGETISIPANPTLTGYTFKGWYLDKELTEAYEFPDTMPAANVTLYAKWEIKKYTVTFNSNGGDVVESIIINYKDLVTKPVDPTKVGHSFAGWYSDPQFKSIYSFGQEMPAESFTLYAKWNVKSYTIAFEENGGTTVNNITQNYGTSLVMPSNPTLTGYTFKGWHTDAECTEAYEFPSTMPAGNVTLYAKWEINKYTVSFNSNGGDVVESITINYKDLVTKPVDPTKVGHSFAGWYSDPQFKSIYSFGQEMPAESFTLYAKWNVKSYTIAFEENGGTTVNNITQNYGTSLVMPSNPTLTGYTFKGWYLDKELTEAYEFPDTMPAEDITLYASWESKQYTLSFEENGGSTITDITLNYQAIITRPSDPTKDGHTFAGWYLDPQFKFVYSFGQMPAENFKVYAKWNVNSYMFTLVNDGIVTSNQVLTYGTTLNLPTPTKYGYEFIGWALIEDGEFVYEGNSLYSITSENVTLYAIWDVKQVTYKFSVNGIVKNTITNDYDSEFSVANPTSYSDENNTYYFAGWKEKDAGENAVLYDFSNGSKLGIENKEYVAVFNSVPYTIKYQNKNGGTTLWETSSSAEDSSFKQYLAYLYQRQQAFSFISEGIKTAVKKTDTLPITVTATYFNLLLNPSLTEGIKEIGVPFNVLPFENQVAVIANQTSSSIEYALNVMNILSVFDLNNNNDYTYITYVSKFNPKDMAAMEVASTATSEYLTLVSAELTKYEDNAYNPYRNDGYIFNGWKTTIDADNENPTKYVYASWVKQIEAPENLHVSTIAKTYVEFSWNQVENAYGYYVNYSINGEVKPTIATQENKVPINVSANDTIEISVTTINADENGNRFETSNAYETPSLKDENITLTQESVSLNSEPCSPISYTHVITGEQEITASGDFFYKTEYGELYLFSNSSYTFKNVVAMEIISGNSFARITDQNGTPTLTTGSNAGTITFRTYKVASGVAKENETYYSYVDGNYSLVSVEVGSSVEGYYLGEEHIAKISLLVSNIGLGTELYSYTSAETSGDYLNTTEFDAYLIGAALTNSSLYTEYASGNYSNGFKFDFDINTTSGNILDFSTFPLEYTFYELDGNEWKEVSDPSSLYIYDEEQDVFYFLKSSGQYKVSISFKKDGYYQTKDSSLDPNKKYYYLENGEYKLFDHENPVEATTYYEHFINVSLPNAFKERNISKEFEFTLNDGINVFNDYGFKKAFSNKDVASINLHSTIKSEFNSHSISYIPYLEDTGLSSKMSHSYMKYGELDIVSGTAEMTENPSYGPLCWKQSTSSTSELDAAGTFYFLDKSGVIYVYDYTNGTHAIKDCEWKEVYGNTETKVGKFKILNDAFGNNPTYTNYGLSVGSIYTRANKESVDLKVNGNYFTIDASDLPYVMSTYGNVAGNGIVASYKIQNVKVSIFDIISGTGASFENMSVIGNTENASETLSGSSGESLTISEQMEKTSGGILAFKNMYIGSDINLDNINISKATIGVHTTYLANATINYTHVWDIWANSIYASGGDTTSVSNSVIDPSGGASFHIEDNFYTIDDKGSSIYTYKDVVVPNSGVLTNPTFDLGYISTHANNLVSGEEQWFKAYSMEIVAMGMKSTLESMVQNAINPQMESNYTIIQTVTDPVTNLTSEKMNFIFLGKTHNIKQGNSEIKLADVKVDFTFGGPIVNTEITEKGIVYTIAKEEVENIEDAEIIYTVVYAPLIAPTQEGEAVSALYIIMSPDGKETLKAYFFFKEKLSETEIIYGMVELYEKE